MREVRPAGLHTRLSNSTIYVTFAPATISHSEHESSERPLPFSWHGNHRLEEARWNAGRHLEDDRDGAIRHDGTNHLFVPPDRSFRQTVRSKNVVSATRFGVEGQT